MLKTKSLNLIHLHLPEAPCYRHAGFSQKLGKPELAQTWESSRVRYMRPRKQNRPWAENNCPVSLKCLNTACSIKFKIPSLHGKNDASHGHFC